jgi:hypothetical protein
VHFRACAHLPTFGSLLPRPVRNPETRLSRSAAICRGLETRRSRTSQLFGRQRHALTLLLPYNCLDLGLDHALVKVIKHTPAAVDDGCGDVFYSAVAKERRAATSCPQPRRDRRQFATVLPARRFYQQICARKPYVVPPASHLLSSPAAEDCARHPVRRPARLGVWKYASDLPRPFQCAADPVATRPRTSATTASFVAVQQRRWLERQLSQPQSLVSLDSIEWSFPWPRPQEKHLELQPSCEPRHLWLCPQLSQEAAETPAVLSVQRISSLPGCDTRPPRVGLVCPASTDPATHRDSTVAGLGAGDCRPSSALCHPARTIRGFEQPNERRDLGRLLGWSGRSP